MSRIALGIIGRLNSKARGISDLLTALIPILPRFLGRPIRSATRSVRRTDRRVRRVSKALGKLR